MMFLLFLFDFCSVFQVLRLSQTALRLRRFAGMIWTSYYAEITQWHAGVFIFDTRLPDIFPIRQLLPVARVSNPEEAENS